MAKRKRLSAPDAEALRALESGFAAKPPAGAPVVPPIAQVAGEAASLSGLAAVTDRVALARDEADAARYRDAQARGLVATEVPIARIRTDYIRRDRVVEDGEAMAELVASIRAGGLRQPIDLVEIEEGYGLISGWRRLRAFQELAREDPALDTIPAFVRQGDDGAEAYLRMVEENEIRANLSHYERGRIAVLAAGSGVFDSVEAAVDTLFAAASKAKRSKVRSFALIHEALGDLLRFPTELTEKAGLRLAAALREGAQPALRAALAEARPENAAAEWKLLQAALAGQGAAAPDPSRGGRPARVRRLGPVRMPNGAELRGEVTPDRIRVELRGMTVGADELERILLRLRRDLGLPVEDWGPMD